jgi:RNA polymerase sigma-70 factor, ECF subfamily
MLAAIDMTAAASRAMPAEGKVRANHEAISSDQALIARIATGDRLAMRTLFTRHQVAVYRWLVRILRDETLAEDVLNDVFVAVWQQAAAFEGRSSVSTWLLAIARYKALSARRRRVDEPLDETVAATIPDPADDPETALEKRDRAALLRESVARLSSSHREVIDLVYYHGKSVAEVSEIVGAPEATVKTRMFHARRKLATLIAAA